MMSPVVWTIWLVSQFVAAIQLTAGLEPVYVGNFHGDLQTQQGQAVYRIPIELPRGPNNIQPNLNLIYNSGDGNGPLGQGWNIDLLSRISRCPQTIAQDGQVRGVRYDAEDRFCLDGQRLVVVDGTYGADRSEYRTEVETNNKIVASEQQGNGPASFRVWTKDGRILDYGSSTTGQLIGQGQNDVHQWNLDQISDRSGNNVTITYLDNSTLLAALYYGTTSVIFKYETRPDQSTAYFNGDIVMYLTHRLTDIAIKNPALTRKYILNYHNIGGGGSNQSLLESIRQCDPSSKCLKPLKFGYDSTNNLNASLPLYKNVISDFGTGWSFAENPRFVRDVNGDGLADIIGFDSACVKVALNDGNGTFLSPQCWVNAFGYNHGWRTENTPREFGDIDGDGLLDIVGFASAGVIVSFNTGSSFKYPVKLLSDFGYLAGSWRTQNHLRFVEDVNGDGRADIVGFGNHGIDVALSKGRVLENVVRWSNDFGYSSGVNWRIENHPRFLKDVNGDNLPDVVGFGSDNVHVSINNGSSFMRSEVWSNEFRRLSSEHPRFVEDMNGDGLVDIVAFSSSGVLISLSTGHSFTPAINVLHNFGYSTSPAYIVGNHVRQVADMTGDGLLDIIGIQNDGVYVSCNMGNRTFSLPKLWVRSFGYGSGWKVNSHPRHILDVNGDGVSDVIGFADAGVHLSLNKNSRPMISEFSDSFNNIKHVSYMTLPEALNTHRYNRARHSNYPIQSPVLPVNVVASLTQQKGTKIANTTTYSYGGFRVDVSGRGNQGFQWQREMDSNNRVIVVEWEQAYPFTGNTKRITHNIQTQTGKDIPISKVVTSYKVTIRLSVYHVTATKEVATSFELDGKEISKIETEYTGTNGYGDPLHIMSMTSGGGQIFIKKTLNTYAANKDVWLVGQLISSQVTHESPCMAPIKRHVIYEYDADTGYIISQIVEPDNELALKTNFTYDQFGNVVTKTDVDPQGQGKFRRVITTFDGNGIFKKASSNGKGHTQRYDYDESTGNLVSLTGANGLKTAWTYDKLGRKIAELQEDGTEITWYYNWDDTVSEAVYNVKIISEGSATKIRMYDALDRVVRERSMDFDGTEIREDIIYNPEGHVHRHSYPHFIYSDAAWTIYHYDILGRVIREQIPASNGSVAEKRTHYSGLTLTRIDSLGRTTRLEKNAQGWLIKVTDHLGGSIQYKHDAVGNMIQTKGTDGYQTNIEYDLMGHKVKLDDSNMGIWKYKHNAFGELIWQEDANKNSLTLEYDILGRLVKRYEPEGSTTWIYDYQSHGLGKIGSVHSSTGYHQSWYYDEHGREYKVVTDFQNQTFIMTTEYDTYGRINKQEYPNGESIYRLYTSVGYLLEVGLGEPNSSLGVQPVWNALAYDALGRIKREQHGNGLITDYEYDSAKLLVGITTHKDGDDTLRHLHYAYDINANLLSRHDLKQGVTENFVYDKLDRLIQSTVISDDITYKKTHNLDYYSNGNIRFNDASGPGPLTYHNTKPHAVVKAGNHTYTYDANGNAIMKDGKQIHWTSYNKPNRFETEEGSIVFKYGPDRNRYMKVLANGDNMLYLGKKYEVHKKNNISLSKMFVYGAMGQLVAIVSKHMTGNSTKSVSYIHADNLGSVDTVSHENSEVVERMNYDAFGLRRTGNWRDSDAKAQYSVRGYTGHEHLPELGLVHMNGRVYDPDIGRFLSPDPHVQDPTNTQALNRYSYALNNPLKHNDPTGYFFKSLTRLFMKIWRPVLAVAVSFVTFGVATPLAAGIVATAGLSGAAATVATGIIAGAVSGFAGGTVATGDLKGGIQGAMGGAIFGGVGGYFGNTWNAERVVARATAGGVVSELSGGKFKDGFVLAGMAASARYLYNSVVHFDVDPWPGGPAVEKTYEQMPVKGADNVGTQGHGPIDPAWFDAKQILGINWKEGSGINHRVLNQIPGVNCAAGFHDAMQVKMDTVLFPGARDWLNVPAMVPAAAVGYAGLLDGPGMPALLVDEARKQKQSVLAYK